VFLSKAEMLCYEQRENSVTFIEQKYVFHSTASLNSQQPYRVANLFPLAEQVQATIKADKNMMC